MRPQVELLESSSRAAQDRASNQRLVAIRLLSGLLPYWRECSMTFLLMAIGACAQAVAPWVIGRAIDRNILTGDSKGLAIMMVVLLGVYSVAVLAAQQQLHRGSALVQRMLARLREQIFERLLHLPLSYFQRHPVGDLISREMSDVDSVSLLMGWSLIFLPGYVFTLLIILVAMLMLNTRLALASLAIIPLMLLTSSGFGILARRAFRETRSTTGAISARLQEDIVGIREAQAFNRIETNIKRFRQYILANRDAAIRAEGVTSASGPTIDVLSILATAIVISYGAHLVNQENLSVGTLAAFLMYVLHFQHSIRLIAGVYLQAQSSLAGGERIYAVLDELPEPKDLPNALKLKTVAGRIDFERVTFAYEPGRTVLNDLTFHIEPGQKVALVGRTGAGKTTIVNLILRFYDPTSGAVRIGGLDVRQVKRESLRKQIAIVLQEPFLFSSTVAENIAFGRLGASRAEVEEASRIVGADAFIEALPHGYDTPLGECGRKISQGQRQLISIARALIAHPRILILDEATSAIDTRTEAIIQRALAKLMEGRTSVIIAHRLSTIRQADSILVIDNGRLVEQGNHGSLLSEGGIYAELYHYHYRDWPASDSPQEDLKYSYSEG
jgi:ATP-binding cassette subfamily B protein/subfamily B ATP-binding cassette protein MsbA